MFEEAREPVWTSARLFSSGFCEGGACQKGMDLVGAVEHAEPLAVLGDGDARGSFRPCAQPELPVRPR